MKKRMTAILTLAIFLVGVFGNSMVAMATAPNTNASGATAYSSPLLLKDANGGNVEVKDLMDLRLKVAGATGDRMAFCYNARKTAPSSQGVSGYVLAADQGEAGYKALADNASLAPTLYEDVHDLIWNGYPYYGSGWSGVTDDPMDYKKQYNLSEQPRLKELYDIQVTQAALSKLTDNIPPYSKLSDAVKTLQEKARNNPAPMNFKLDLYDGSKCPGQAGNKMQNLLVAASDLAAKQNLVQVSVGSKWYQADGTTAYIGRLPDVVYELYEGDIVPGEKPLNTFSKGTITLIDDNQKYTVREVVKTDADKFSVANDQVIDFSQVQPPTYAISFNHIEKNGTTKPPAEVPSATSLMVGAEVTLDGKNPADANFSFVLKDSAGNIVETKNNIGRLVAFTPLSFDKEGTYTYTLNELVGGNSAIKYDTTVYELTVTVTEKFTPEEKKPFLEAKPSWKKNEIAYDGLTPLFENTTVNSETTSVTVNKVWKNDKLSSRPSYVNVQLYRNGSVYGNPVRLDANNNWRYTWSNLDTDYKWTVNEPTVPAGYIKSVKVSGSAWTITNTAKSLPITTPSTTKPTITKPTTTTSKTTKKPTVTKPTTKSSRTNNDSDDDDDDSDRDDRSTPQTDDTSHLNWWVTGLIVSLSGMCLIGLLWGLSRRRPQGRK